MMIRKPIPILNSLLSIYSILGGATTVVRVDALITGSIKIVGDSGVQYLPGSYVNTFPRWTLRKETRDIIPTIGTTASSPSSSTSTDEFVNPSSTSELWWPSDLSNLQARPTLDVLLKSGGIPEYAMAGLEIRVPGEVSGDGEVWRNFGMNCQPLAKQWTRFAIAVESDFRVECFWGTRVEGTTVASDGDNVTDEVLNWYPMDREPADDADGTSASSERRKEKAIRETLAAMNVLGETLADLRESSPLSSGMHVVSVPIGGEEEWVDLPSIPPPPPAREGEPSPPSFKLASVATSESDAGGMLSLDEDMLSITATSVLSVDVSSIAAGSDSEYLPEAYKPLYIKG